MRIGGLICLILAVALAVLAFWQLTQADGDLGLGSLSAYLLPGVLMLLLGLWLFQQPKAPPSDEEDEDESAAP